VWRVEHLAQLTGGGGALDAITRRRAAVGAISSAAKSPAPEISPLNSNLNGPAIAVRPSTKMRF
jgi:hypothetical protein